MYTSGDSTIGNCQGTKGWHFRLVAVTQSYLPPARLPTMRRLGTLRRPASSGCHRGRKWKWPLPPPRLPPYASFSANCQSPLSQQSFFLKLPLGHGTRTKLLTLSDGPPQACRGRARQEFPFSLINTYVTSSSLSLDNKSLNIYDLALHIKFCWSHDVGERSLLGRKNLNKS